MASAKFPIRPNMDARPLDFIPQCSYLLFVNVLILFSTPPFMLPIFVREKRRK